MLVQSSNTAWSWAESWRLLFKFDANNEKPPCRLLCQSPFRSDCCTSAVRVGGALGDARCRWAGILAWSSSLSKPLTQLDDCPRCSRSSRDTQRMVILINQRFKNPQLPSKAFQPSVEMWRRWELKLQILREAAQLGRWHSDPGPRRWHAPGHDSACQRWGGERKDICCGSSPLFW